MRKTFVLMAAMALTLALAASAAQAAYQLRIGHHAQAFGSVDVVAWKLGYFDQTLGKGNYTMKQFSQGKLMAQAILSRSVDVAEVAARPYVSLIGKKVKGLTAIAVQSYWCGLTSVVVKKGSPLNNLKQLKGRNLIAGKATSTYYGFTHFLLPAFGLKESDFRAINANTTERIPALIAGTVDFAIVQEPGASIAISKGLVTRLKGVDWCKYDDPPFVIAADPRVVKAHPKVIVNYLRGWLRSAKLFKSDYNKFTSVYHRHLTSKGRKAPLSVIRSALKGLRMHPQLDDRFYNYSEKMNKVLLKDKKTRSIADFRGGQGVMDSFIKAAIKAENYK